MTDTSATRTLNPTQPPSLRQATDADRPAAERLLGDSGLPAADIADLFAARTADFIVADDPLAPGELAAIGGIEVCSDDALLRSVAVRPEWRSHGLGQELVHGLVRRAEQRGLRALYLLTTTAERYFPRFGFVEVERGAVPAGIAGTFEFRSSCPASAVVMERLLRA